MEQKLKDAASKLPETKLTFQEICNLSCTTKKKPIIFGAKRLLTAAACFVLLLGIGFGTYAYAAEVKEFNAAVQFFDENGLPLEGLSRSEIKAVYRDITTASFSYQKTAEVILSSGIVGGFEIDQAIPTREELEAIWNNRTQRTDVRYEILGVDPDKYYLQRFDGETLVWSFDCSDFLWPNYAEVSDGVLIYGRHMKDYDALLVKVDFEGNILWRDQPNNGFYYEQVDAVLENDDGSYAVFSSAKTSATAGQHICLSQYTKDGERTLYQSHLMRGAVTNATRLGDGYLVQLGNGSILKMNREGTLSDSFSYSSDQYEYHIQDLIEFNGRIYLSAYTSPKLAADEPTYGGRTEIARILKYAYEQKVFEIPDEELTPVVRSNYNAVLLVCDPNSGTPKEFYSIDGSFGGALTVNNGMLLWNVESITTTRYSPMTNAFTIAGSCSVFRYTFHSSGTLIEQEQTDEIVSFYK